MKLICRGLLFVFLFSCSSNKGIKSAEEMPSCLVAKIKTMSADTNGSPQSLTRFTYRQQTVYYMVLPCCDQYNIVYDSACNILGYPDGGFTGRGDGKMISFKDEALEGKVIWKKEGK